MSPLYQCVRHHAVELNDAGLVRRRVESEVLERFRACGDLHQGFARIYCDQCGRDYLLAYSCKTRDFCPSCHHNRIRAKADDADGRQRRARNMIRCPFALEKMRYYGYYSNRARGARRLAT